MTAPLGRRRRIFGIQQVKRSVRSAGCPKQPELSEEHTPLPVADCSPVIYRFLTMLDHHFLGARNLYPPDPGPEPACLI
jgi:hypothetical protein